MTTPPTSRDLIEAWYRDRRLPVPALDHEATFQVPLGFMRVLTNEATIRDAVADRLCYYPRVGHPVEPGDPVTIRIFATDTAPDRIELPRAFREDATLIGEARSCLSSRREHKLYHYRNGPVQCLFRYGDLLAAFDAGGGVCILANKTAWAPENGHDWFLDLLQILYGRIRGAVCMHAACVEIDGTAVLIGGKSGAGKTTTSTALYRDGNPLLTDEMLLLFRPRDGSQGVAGFGWLTKPRFVGSSPGALADISVSAPEAVAYQPILPPESGPRPDPAATRHAVPSRVHSPKGAFELDPEDVRRLVNRRFVPRKVILLRAAEKPGPEHHFTRLDPEQEFLAIMGLWLDPTFASNQVELMDLSVALQQQCAGYQLALGQDLDDLPRAFRAMLVEP